MVGDIVSVDTTVAANDQYKIIQGHLYVSPRDAIIISKNVGKRPYTVKAVDGQFIMTCSEKVIDEVYGKGCSHTDVVYSDDREEWICPFCSTD